MERKGYGFIIAAAVLWGLIGPLSRLAFQEGLSPMEVAFWRAVLTSFLFGGQAFIGGGARVDRGDIPALLIFGVSGVTLFYSAYQESVSSGGAALASILLYTAPAWVAVLSRIVFRERITRGKLIALALTLAGVAGISLGGSDPLAGGRLDARGVASGLLSGFCYSLYYIFGKHFSGRYNAPALFSIILPVGALGLLPWVSFTTPTPVAWGALAAMSLFCTYGAYHFYYAGLRHLEPGRAAITATLEPVVAAFTAFCWWGERFTPSGYAGAFLILSAVIWMMRVRK